MLGSLHKKRQLQSQSPISSSLGTLNLSNKALPWPTQKRSVLQPSSVSQRLIPLNSIFFEIRIKLSKLRDMRTATFWVGYVHEKTLSLFSAQVILHQIDHLKGSNTILLNTAYVEKQHLAQNRDRFPFIQHVHRYFPHRIDRFDRFNDVSPKEMITKSGDPSFLRFKTIPVIPPFPNLRPSCTRQNPAISRQ